MVKLTQLEKATFAAGCFWGVESTFRQVNGVVDTKVGYTGGSTKNPTYDDVCTDTTGHAEAIEITFNPERVNFTTLLEVFWKNHDPTQLNRQGPDYGTQYRSAIFYHTLEQRKEAEASLQDYEKKLGKKIVTEIVKATTFYPAEEYHQRYLEKRGKFTCH